MLLDVESPVESDKKGMYQWYPRAATYLRHLLPHCHWCCCYWTRRVPRQQQQLLNPHLRASQDPQLCRQNCSCCYWHVETKDVVDRLISAGVKLWRLLLLSLLILCWWERWSRKWKDSDGSWVLLWLEWTFS